jgi:hypothetical protein
MDLENNVIAEWYSITEAKKQTGAKTIWEVIKGKYKTSAGYKWKLKE